MNKKTLTIVGIILLVLIVGVFWYEKNQQKQSDKQIVQQDSQEIKKQKDDDTQNKKELEFEEIDTSDWILYEDKAWGFSIKYPKKLYIRENAVNDKGCLKGSGCIKEALINSTIRLVISDQERMGTQDIMPNEKIHVRVLAYHDKSKTKDSLKRMIPTEIVGYSHGELQKKGYYFCGDVLFILGTGAKLLNSNDEEFNIAQNIRQTFKCLD